MRTNLAIVLAAAMIVPLALAAVGCKSETAAPTPSSSAKTPGQPSTPAAAEIAQKTCPVRPNEKIDPTVFVDYNGRKIYFCCRDCIPVFQKDPVKYLKIVDEQIKAAPAATPTPPEPKAPAVPEKIAYWTCTMHPDVHADKAGNCPTCKMPLVPVPEKPAAPAPATPK
jgi:YHS domain-containing protein